MTTDNFFWTSKKEEKILLKIVSYAQKQNKHPRDLKEEEVLAAIKSKN